MNLTQAAGFTDPDALFGAHVEILSARYAALLERHRFDGVAVYSGSPRYRFRDDQTYPFRSGPFYRQWVPADDHASSFVLVRPGQRPVLVLHLPDDYWHSVPEAPDGPWTAHFDIRVVSSPGAARAELPGDLSGCALVGDPADREDGDGATHHIGERDIPFSEKIEESDYFLRIGHPGNDQTNSKKNPA